MQKFLLATGAIAAAIGLCTIAFGIEVYDFSFGNTLIIAGTTTLMGGLIVVGLATAVRELARIAQAPGGRVPSRGMVRADAAEALATGAHLRGGSSARPFASSNTTDGSLRDLRPSEPRFATLPATDGLDEPPAVRQAQNVYPLRPTGDSALVDHLENVPLSPRTPSRETIPARSENANTAKAGAPKPSDARGDDSLVSDLRTAEARAVDARGARLHSKAGAGNVKTNGAAATQTQGAQGVALDAPLVATRAERIEPARRINLFDAVWPAEGTRRARSANEAVARELQPEPVAITEEHVEPVLVPKADDAPPSRPRSEPRPVSILKSGVVDGMAYTLYTDGSIEAQLPQSTMRFSSIDELRAHLEHGA